VAESKKEWPIVARRVALEMAGGGRAMRRLDLPQRDNNQIHPDLKDKALKRAPYTESLTPHDSSSLLRRLRTTT